MKRTTEKNRGKGIDLQRKGESEGKTGETENRCTQTVNERGKEKGKRSVPMYEFLVK